MPRGAADALLIESPQNYGQWFPRGTYQENAKAVDRFYANELKRVIPLLNALGIIKDEQNK